MVVCWMKAKLGPVFYCSDKSLVFSSKHLPIYSSTSWLKPDFNYPLSQTSSCNDPLIVKTLSMIWLTRGPIKFSSVFLPQVDDWKLWLCDCRELNRGYLCFSNVDVSSLLVIPTSKHESFLKKGKVKLRLWLTFVFAWKAKHVINQCCVVWSGGKNESGFWIGAPVMLSGDAG